jgi:predicted transposase YbfD/YdcC
VVEAKLGTWAEGLLAGTPASLEAEEGIAIDGKTLRGSQKQGAPGAHLLSALAHRLGLTLAQQAVADKTNEIPELRADIATVFALPPLVGETRTVAETVDSGHGRSEQRRLQTSDILVGYSDWPGLAQVFQLERQGIRKKTGEVREEVVAGVTSLAPERADTARLLALVRGHWHIENKSHWVRDVTFDEDRSQVCCGHIPQVMAALRNTAIGLLRWAGETNIAAACRRLAAQPVLALELIGIQLEN